MFVFAIALAVFSNVFYHLGQKSMPAQLNPFVCLSIVYLVALLGCVVLFLVFPFPHNSVELDFKRIGAPVLVGIAALGVEIGFLLAYRSGWSLAWASLVTNVTVSLVLVPLGFYVFKDEMNMSKVAGMLFGCLGLYLILRK